MPIRDRLARAFRTPPAVDRAPFADLRRPGGGTGLELRQLPTVAIYRYGKPYWPTYTMERGIRYYEQVVVAFACVNLIADAAATARVRVYDEALDDAEIPDHPLRQLMRHPNNYMSESEWLNAMVKTAAVCGFAVSEIERAGAGRPVALHPLRADWLSPIPRRDNLVDWQYRIPGGGTPILKAEDVVDWTYQGGPLLAQGGITPMVAASRELGMDLELTNFVKAFFDSGAIPQIGLIPSENSEYDQAEADVIKEKFRQAAGTPWEPIVMQAITDVKRLGFDLNEMAYKDLRALTSTEICSSFRVPPVMIGTLVGLENSPWSKYEEARRSFYEDTITPLWARLDGALTRSLLPEFETSPTVTLEFDTSDVPALQDDDSAAWLHASAPNVGQFLTVNDRRGLVGLPPLQGGDVRILSIADIETPAIEASVARAMGDESEWRVLTPSNGHALRLSNGHHPPLEKRAAIATQNKQTIIRMGERGAPLLRRFWRAQGRRVTTALFGTLSGEWPVEARLAAEAIDWDDETRQLERTMSRIYATNGKAAFANASSQLGIDVSWDLANPNIARVMEQLGQRVAGITETTRIELAQTISDGLKEGVTLSELADRVQNQFEGYGDARAMTVARTESMLSYCKSSTLAYAESGVVESVQFFDSETHCDDYGASDGLSCCARNGLIVDLAGVDRHIEAEHPNGSLATAPILAGPGLGEE